MDIITVRMHGGADNSPLEMISAARLAYLQRVEAAAKGLVAALSCPGGTVEPPLAQSGSPDDLPKNGIHLPKK